MSEVESLPVQYSGIKCAGEQLESDHVVKRTPIGRSTSLGDLVGTDVYLKMEHLQWTGSFKTRSTYNKIQQDTDHGIDELVAAGAGSHAQSITFAVTECGADSTAVMPENTPQTKIDATRDHGAEVKLVDKDFQGTMTYAQSLAKESDVEFVHAYGNYDIVVRQGTFSVKVYRSLPGMDTVAIPIGGGRLVSGIATAIKRHGPEIRVVGVQAGSTETAHESPDKGVPVTLDDTSTIADGIATGDIFKLALRTIEEHIGEVVTISGGEITEAVLPSLERARQVVEGVGAASVAAVLSDNLSVEGEIVIPLLCGDNLDMTMLQTVLVHALTSRRQMLHLRVRIRDELGEMTRLPRLVADRSTNIHDVHHVRAVDALNADEAYLLFHIETRGAEHAATVVDTIEDAGHAVDDVSGPS